MNKMMLKIILPLIMVFVFSTFSFADQTKTITVTAYVPTVATGLNVTVSKIRASNNYWEYSGSDLPIDFGTLNLDSVYNIFRATYYYAVDIGVVDNTGATWTLTHLRNSIHKGADNLDNNVNVTFIKQTSASSGIELRKVSFANSGNITYSKNDLTGGWLRIYYGIASGSNDASGVTPIGLDKPTGTYTGSVVIRLTP